MRKSHILVLLSSVFLLVATSLLVNRHQNATESKKEWPTRGDSVEFARSQLDSNNASSLFGLGVKLYYNNASTQDEGVNLIRKAADLNLQDAKDWLIAYELGQKSIDFERYNTPK